MTLEPGGPDTSLATIQSAPFFASLAWACAAIVCVSAAKPTSRVGRWAWRPSVANISGFSTSMSGAGAPDPSFLIFCSAASAVRQSATAATMIATSAGSAASTAASISRAVSTSIRVTPAGVGRCTGPATSVTRAPACAAAAAMAKPCLPEDRLAM